MFSDMHLRCIYVTASCSCTRHRAALAAVCIKPDNANQSHSITHALQLSPNPIVGVQTCTAPPLLYHDLAHRHLRNLLVNTTHILRYRSAQLHHCLTGWQMTPCSVAHSLHCMPYSRLLLLSLQCRSVLLQQCMTGRHVILCLLSQVATTTRWAPSMASSGRTCCGPFAWEACTSSACSSCCTSSSSACRSLLIHPCSPPCATPSLAVSTAHFSTAAQEVHLHIWVLECELVTSPHVSNHTSLPCPRPLHSPPLPCPNSPSRSSETSADGGSSNNKAMGHLNLQQSRSLLSAVTRHMRITPAHCTSNSTKLSMHAQAYSTPLYCCYQPCSL